MQAVRSLAPMGRAAIAGISEEAVSINTYRDVVGEEAKIVGVSDHTREEIEYALAPAAQGKLRFDEIVTQRLPLKSAASDSPGSPSPGVRSVVMPGKLRLTFAPVLSSTFRDPGVLLALRGARRHHMKTGASILGIVGGAIALIVGVISFFVGDLGQSLGIQGSVMRQILSIGLPVAALIGGGIAPKSGVLGGVLMAASAVGILVVLEIGVVSLITAIPIGIGAILALLGAATSSKSEVSNA